MNEYLPGWIVVGMVAGCVAACGGASSPDMLIGDADSGDAVVATSESAPGEKAPGTPPSARATYPELSVFGPAAAPSLAPVHLAIRGLYPGAVTLENGGVWELCGETPSADLVVDSETELLRASLLERCANLRVLFTVSENLHRIVAKRSSGIASMPDLADKRVLVERGSPSHRFLGEMAARVNLVLGDGPGEIHVVEGERGQRTFESGRAPDAVATWEPAAEEFEASLGDDAVSLELDANGARVYRELVNLHANARSLEDPEKRRGIARFVKTLSEAAVALERDKAAAIPLLLGPTGASAAVLAQSLEYQRFAGTLVGDVHGVLEEGEFWQASLDGREARTPQELSILVDWGVYLTALWPEQAWD